MDPALVFPSEIFEEILIRVDGERINDISLVCKHWLEFINDSEYVWRHYCKNFSSKDIQSGIELNMSWKEIYLKFREKYTHIRRWEGGQHQENKEWVCDNLIYEFDVDTWGYLLDVEFTRSTC